MTGLMYDMYINPKVINKKIICQNSSFQIRDSYIRSITVNYEPFFWFQKLEYRYIIENQKHNKKTNTSKLSINVLFNGIHTIQCKHGNKS